MRLTNNEIMVNYKKKNNIPLDYELYSSQVWYNKGYKVKKGSVCKHRVEMYKRADRCAKHTYKKWFSLFTREQVEAR